MTIFPYAKNSILTRLFEEIMKWVVGWGDMVVQGVLVGESNDGRSSIPRDEVLYIHDYHHVNFRTIMKFKRRQSQFAVCSCTR